MDWASEYAVEQSLKIFDSFGITPTIFATNKLGVLEKAKELEKIDLSIHPNFMPDSSQGASFDEVIEFCMNLVPDTISFRCHRYFEVNDIVEKFVKFGIKYSSNICCLMENIEPYLHRCGNISFPVYLEDGAYLLNNLDLNFASIKKTFFPKGGLKVINMHPMHLMLNTPYFKYTRDIKDKLTREEWKNLDAQAIAKLNSSKHGIRDFCMELMSYAKNSGAEIKTLKQIYNEIITIKSL